MSTQLHLMSIACAGWLSPCIAAAARLGIADLLSDEPRTADELADLTGTCAPVLLRVLRVLVSAKVFEQLDDGRFTHTPESQLLRTDHPESIRYFCILAGSEYHRAFGELMHTISTGEPGFRRAFGGSIYDYMDQQPDTAEVYDRAMQNLAAPVGVALAASYDFSGVRTVVDIGGGGGTLLRGLLLANREMRGICFDRPGVCERARRQRESSDEASLALRLEFVTGSFFETIPDGGDVYILKNVLHNWTDESSRRILANIHTAMVRRLSSDGKPPRLLVIEPLISDGDASPYQRMDDLFQMVICEEGTTARTEPAMRRLLASASFAVTETRKLLTNHTVLETVPAA